MQEAFDLDYQAKAQGSPKTRLEAMQRLALSAGGGVIVLVERTISRSLGCCLVVSHLNCIESGRGLVCCRVSCFRSMSQ